MRISPLGIFGANLPQHLVARWAGEDAAITHPHPVCVQANILFTLAIAMAIRTGAGAREVYTHIMETAKIMRVDPSLMEVIVAAETASPDDYQTLQGWVLVAFQNALWQLLHAGNVEAGLVNTVMRGGDTDTNGAICGALLGAVYGIESMPERWVRVIENCRPRSGDTGVHQPRPERYWPVDAMELASKLLLARKTA
jgi:ADP-ribosyl-[dinitrogen reductase] hydrolase